MFVQAQANLIASLEAAITAVGDACTVHLIKATMVITSITTLAELLANEADYTGYGGVVLGDWMPPYWQSQGVAVAYSTAPAVFQPTGSAVGNIIYGYWVQTGAMTPVLVGAELLATPVPLGNALDQLAITVPLSIADGDIPGVIY